MSQSAQPGFFTLGVSPDRYQLPHPRLGLPVILLIRRVQLPRQRHNSKAASSRRTPQLDKGQVAPFPTL